MPLELYPFDKKASLDFKLSASVKAHFDQTKAQFGIDYCLKGDLDQLLLPPAAQKKGERCHDLWKETCFEAFFKITGSNSYLEFNFSPSGNWNCYFFETYRAGMREYLGVENVALSFESSEELNLKCLFDLDFSRDKNLAILNKDNLRIGLSAILFQRTEGPSYFSLTHPISAPDFHHEKSFVFKLKTE